MDVKLTIDEKRNEKLKNPEDTKPKNPEETKTKECQTNKR